MSLKAFVLMAPIALGGAWFAGAFGDSAYSREVYRTPRQVMSALADLDVREQPGSPGTDPSASGGVRPQFRTERTENSISWTVMSGDQVATRMTAHLEPLDGGRRTRVTASVERGDAPDDFVSPAFRSEGITLGLFSLALEGELDELTAPPRASAQSCSEIMDRFAAESFGAGMAAPADNLEQAVGDTSRQIIRLNALRQELRRAGCPLEGGPDFTPVSDRMGRGDTAGSEVSFEAGEPMVDVRRR